MCLLGSMVVLVIDPDKAEDMIIIHMTIGCRVLIQGSVQFSAREITQVELNSTNKRKTNTNYPRFADIRQS